MSTQGRRGARARNGAVALVVALGLAGGLLAFVGAGSVPASADPVRDADPAAAAQAVDRLIAADAALRLNGAALPGAEAAVKTTAKSVELARAEATRVHAVGPPAPGVGAGNVVDNAADAILDELAPEQANATVLLAEQAAASAVARRDDVKAAYQAAGGERVQLVASLAQSGQRRTWWCVALLDRLGAPVTKENLRGLFAWIDAESNGASLRNPLATTMGAPGARNANQVGVKGYPSDAVGLDATVQTLLNGSYPGILAALARGDSALELTKAVAMSPWGTGLNAVRRLQMSGG
jgi:hypothetical protein